MISKMPLRTICNLQEVERQRMLGCSHRAKPVGPKNTKLNGDPIDCHKCDCGDNEPDFTVTPPKVDMGDYHD